MDPFLVIHEIQVVHGAAMNLNQIKIMGLGPTSAAPFVSRRYRYL